MNLFYYLCEYFHNFVFYFFNNLKFMKFFYIFLTLAFTNLGIFAQSSGIQLYEKVMNELPKNELLKLKSITDLYENADNLMQEADKMLQNIDRINVKFPFADKKEKKKYEQKIKKLRSQSTKNIVLASNIYTQADTLLYSVFKSNIHVVENKKSKERTQLAILLEKEAIEHNKASIALSSLLDNRKNKNELFEIIAEIRQLEILAINKLSAIFGLYLRWSDILNMYKSEIKIVNKPNINFSLENISSDSLDLNKDKIIFSLQIYSKKEALSDEELNELKSEFSEIYIFIEDSWYCYSVGVFSNYLTAAAEKKKERDFVIAVKNGSKIDIEKAILQSNNKKK